jgi:hypothetical protein
MTRIRTAVAGLGCLAALVAVPSALAAYTSTKLEVTQTGNTVIAKISSNPSDDPTASTRVFAPTGTQVTTSQAPGAAIGSVTASAKALALGGADVPFTGQIVVAAPGQVPATAQAACLQGATPLATWVMALQAVGQTVRIPLYVVATSGATAALGPAYVQVCLPPPDVPESRGGAPFGVKLYSATLTIRGVFSAVPVGAWIAFWTPYVPGTGAPNIAGTIATPAAVAPGAVTISARRAGRRGAIVSGQVTQAGQRRGNATVTLFAGAKRNRLTRVARKTVTATGAFRFAVGSGTFFRVTAVAAPGAAGPLCTALQPQLGTTPCVNPTTNGFTVLSRTVRRRG